MLLVYSKVGVIKPLAAQIHKAFGNKYMDIEKYEFSRGG